MLTTKQNMAESPGVAVYLGHYANEHSQFMLITITRLTYTVFNICKYCKCIINHMMPQMDLTFSSEPDRCKSIPRNA